MNQLLFYLLQVLVASGLLYCYYHVALRNKKFHRYNRFYLLMVVVTSIVVPFLNIPVYFSAKEAGSSVVLQTLQVISSPLTATDENELSSVQTTSTSAFQLTGKDLLYIFYFSICLIFLTRIFLSFNKIRLLIKNHTIEFFDKIKFVNTDEPGTPFSFFRWLFWNRKLDMRSEKGEQIFRHELFHIRQKHSWDIIFMELLSMIFWINPFFHLAKREIKAIHEFLADEFAIKDNDKWQYAELLLMQVLNTNSQLVNPFFHNQIKRRIAMITTSAKPGYQYLSKIMVLPVAAIIILLFAFTFKNKAADSQRSDKLDHSVHVYLNKDEGGFYGEIESSDTTKPLKANDLEKYLVVIDGVVQEKRGVKHLDSALVLNNLPIEVHIYRDKAAITKYGEKGKDGVIDIKIDKSNIPRVKPKPDTLKWIKDARIPKRISPTSAQLKAWQDTKMYGVWMDGKRINNDQLSKYSPSDFALYYSSKLLKNAINYGKHYYEICLYTEEYYNKHIAIRIGVLDTTPVKDGSEVLVRDVTISDTTEPKEEPLIVLDGKLRPDLTFSSSEKEIAPEEIERIVVLKDKTATDKYGPSAKFGAFEITTKNKAAKKPLEVKEVTLKQLSAADNKVFVKLEVVPTFPGGHKEWLQFLRTHLRATVPIDSGAKEGTYTVVLRFIVDKEGTLGDIRALTNHGFGMEQECFRVMKLSPKWNPGKQNGHIVNAYRDQPFTFVIADDEPTPGDKMDNFRMIEQLAAVYPNPATNKAVIQFNSNAIQKGEVRIYDMNAKLKMTTRINFNKGENTVVLNVASLSSGTYVINVAGADNKTAKALKLIKK